MLPLLMLALGLQLVNNVAHARVDAEKRHCSHRAAHGRAHRRGRAQPQPAGRAEARAGDRARAQAHRRRPARRPGRQAADHRAHQRVRPHLDAGPRGAGGDAAVGARPDRQAGAPDRRAGRLACRGRLAPGPGQHPGRMEVPGRGHRAHLPGPLLCADHAHPARVGVQHHQAQRRHERDDLEHLPGRRLHPDHPGQRPGHPDRTRRPAGQRPRHGEHEITRQANAWPVPG